MCATLVIGDTNPLNPFHHQFHPQHKFPEPETPLLPSNIWTIDWKMIFTFSEDPPNDLVLAGWGDTQGGGVFEEEIMGLRNTPIKARGTFILQRASSIGELNDGMSG